MKFKRNLIAIFLTVLFSVAVFAGSQQTSSTPASTIITNARYYLNAATDTAFWDNTELLVYVNQGTMDIAARTRCLESTTTVSLTPGTVEYSISSDYIDMSTVTYTNPSGVVKGLLRKNPQSIGTDPYDSNIGEPVFWYEWGGKVGAYPALSAGTGTLTLYYVSRPAAVISTANVLVPAFYDRALTLYVVAQALLKEGQYGKSARLMGEYLAELDRYRTDFVERPQEPEASIKRQ